MKDYVQKIIDKNKNLFNNNSKIEKINIGFTNTLYSIDNKYILKICSLESNNKNFLNEIDFYLKNKNNPYIPKLYDYFKSNKKEEFSYLVLEKVNGKSLYCLWHLFDENKKEETIMKICNLMKSFHSCKGEKYDWGNFIIDKLNTNLNKCIEKNLFDKPIIEDCKYILDRINIPLESNNFHLVHSDIHFDNILLTDDDRLIIIDFETSIYAPLDYELDIFLRMCNNPLKYASKETEKYIKKEDYKDIEKKLKKYYPQLFEFKYYVIRHTIYDLEANLRLLPRFPKDNELKTNVINIIMKLKETLN
ncbi:MAG: phosphotransferase [Bacilli bacterium]